MIKKTIVLLSYIISYFALCETDDNMLRTKENIAIETTTNFDMTSAIPQFLSTTTELPENEISTTENNDYTTIKENEITTPFSKKFIETDQNTENYFEDDLITTTEGNLSDTVITPAFDINYHKENLNTPFDFVSDNNNSSTQSSLLNFKKGKFMKDNTANINDLSLPGSSAVWTLVGMKENPVNRIEMIIPSSTETSDSLEKKEDVIGTKNLSDWSKIMKEVPAFNYSNSKINTINTSIDSSEHTLFTNKIDTSETSTIENVQIISGIGFQNDLNTTTANPTMFIKINQSTEVPTKTTESPIIVEPTTEHTKSVDQKNPELSLETHVASADSVNKNNLNDTETDFDLVTLINDKKLNNSSSMNTITGISDSTYTTELNSFSYEVNGIPLNMNFTYSSHPNSHDKISKSNNESSNSNFIIGVSIGTSCVLLMLLVMGVLYVMRKRKKQTSYGQRCRPVGLDAYSLDNVSVCHSIRRKGGSMLRQSKKNYGNVAFDDPSLRHNVLRAQEIEKFAEKKLSIYEEFKDVPQIIARSDEVPYGCEDRNRYANVIPLPETRVLLKRQGDDEKTEYINANYVRGPKDVHNYYIATQGPLDSTIADFWRMIWENDSRVIVMATDLLENGVEKCAEYLPHSVTLDNHIVHGIFQITLQNREVKEKYAVSTLTLKNNDVNSIRQITHYWYKWPETGVPSDVASVITLLSEVKMSLKHCGHDSDSLIEDIKKKNTDQGPLTIHCSNGTGRTGTLIACDIAIRSLDEPMRNLDIPQIVYYIRRGRASSIQTKEQYEFIYKVASNYASNILLMQN